MATERVRQQKTPGQFDSGTTGMSAPDLGAASFSTQGVARNSQSVMAGAMAGAIPKLSEDINFGMKYAREFNNGRALASMEQEHEDNIQAFADSRQTGDLAVEASSLNEASNALWSRLGDGSSVEDINTVDSKYKSTIERLQRAHKQGVMSAEEFANNTLAITKKAINQNPYLYNELTQHAQKVLGMSGVDGFIKAEQNAQAAQEKVHQNRVDDARAMAKTLNISPSYDTQGNLDLGRLEAEIKVRNDNAFAATTLTQATQAKTAAEKAAATSFIKTHGISAAVGLVDNLEGQVLEIQRGDGNQSDKLYTIRNAYARSKAEIDAKAGPYMADPLVKQNVEAAHKIIDASLANLESFSNLGDQEKYYANKRSIAASKDTLQLYQHGSPAAVEMLSKVLTNLGPKILQDNPETFTALNMTLLNTAQGVVGGLGTSYGLSDGRGDNLMAKSMGLIAQDKGAGSSEVLGNMIGTVWGDANSGKGFKSDGEKYKFYDSYIRMIGDPKNIEGFKNLDPEASGKAAESFQDYMEMTLSKFSADVSKVSGLKAGVLPNGAITLTGSNNEDTARMTHKYTIRINNGIKALSNLMGVSTQQAAQTMFEQYPELGIFAPQEGDKKKGSGFGNRPDGTEKGTGFLGVQKSNSGNDMTEYSVGIEVNGKEMDVPTFVPGLTAKELAYLKTEPDLNARTPMNDSIVDKAQAHAEKRLAEGKSVFSGKGDGPKGDGRPNETNPLNITIPGKQGKFQSFDNVDEGIVAASKQLDRYAEGKLSGMGGTKLDTVSKIVGKWNNENEKGSSSKKDYMKTVVQYSGLSPDEVLDLSDPNTKADLIYGMSKAEGKGLRPSQILAALRK